MSILSDDFYVHAYLHGNNHKKSDDNLDLTKLSTGLLQLVQYCKSSKQDRSKIDEYFTEKYGCCFQTYYENLKENPDGIPIKETMELEELPEYTETDLEEAKNWSEISRIPLIFPTANLYALEELWQNWSSFPKSIKNDSDNASIRFFGIDNYTHYKFLKSNFLADGAINNYPTTESVVYPGDPLRAHEKYICNQSMGYVDRLKDLLTLLAKKNENYEDAIVSDIVNKVIDSNKEYSQDIQYDSIPFRDLPFYTPEELIDFGICQDNPEANYYNCMPVTDIVSEEYMKEWFESYKECFSGNTISYDPVKWKNTLRQLYLKRSIAEDTAPYNQAILNLGWCPEAEFSPENQVKAFKRINTILRRNQGSTQIVDISDFDDNCITTESNEISNVLKPVFIILESGKSFFSNAIKFVTQSNYSHAAISFDPKLEKIVSFGIEGSKKGAIGGLIIENIKTKPKDIRFAVYTIFLKPEDYNKLKKNVDFMIKNINKTVYSYLNIVISHLFHIPLEMDRSMVCSQFVDKMLKLADIDITNKNSSLVSPAYLNRMAKSNKKIYKVFEGLSYKYNFNKIMNKINTLLKKAKPIKEMYSSNSVDVIFEMIENINSLVALQEISSRIDIDALEPRVRTVYENMILPCLEAECYLAEAKNAPIQMDKYGNVFINNIKKRNYESDYQMSHKLLKQYEKSGNTEGMKYELARLWAMILFIEEKIHSKKFMNMELDERNNTPEMKVYPKLINDFQYFLGIVMKEDPKFNFSKYYETTQFNADNIKIGRNTILWSINYLKAVLTGI